MEKKWTKWYAKTLHVIAYRSKEMLFGMHAFNYNCFLDYFNCVFTQIRCLSVLLYGNPMKVSFWCIYREECYASEWSVPRTGSNTGEYQWEKVLLLSQSQCLYHNKIFVLFIGKSVMLVNGAYRGQAATLESINERKFSCSVSLNVCIITRYLFYL